MKNEYDKVRLLRRSAVLIEADLRDFKEIVKEPELLHNRKKTFCHL